LGPTAMPYRRPLWSRHFNLVAELWLRLLWYCLHRVTHRMTSRASSPPRGVSRKGVTLNVTLRASSRPDGSHPQVLSAMISSSRHGTSPDSGPARFYPTCPTGRADPEVPPTCPTGRLARVYPTCPTGRVPDSGEVLGGIAGHRRGRTLRGGPSRTRLLLYLLQLAPPPFA
jgi:hypothetical protein